MNSSSKTSCTVTLPVRLTSNRVSRLSRNRLLSGYDRVLRRSVTRSHTHAPRPGRPDQTRSAQTGGRNAAHPARPRRRQSAGGQRSPRPRGGGAAPCRRHAGWPRTEPSVLRQLARRPHSSAVPAEPPLGSLESPQLERGKQSLAGGQAAELSVLQCTSFSSSRLHNAGGPLPTLTLRLPRRELAAAGSAADTRGPVAGRSFRFACVSIDSERARSYSEAPRGRRGRPRRSQRRAPPPARRCPPSAAGAGSRPRHGGKLRGTRVHRGVRAKGNATCDTAK